MDFDPALLQADYQRCRSLTFNPHFNKKDYEGTWTSIYLRSAGGQLHNLSPEGSGSTKYADTALMQECGYFRQVIDAFECPKQSIRIMNLRPGSRILPHRDNCLGYEDGVFRIHVPVHTHALVDFYVDGNRLPMKEGEGWYVNFNLLHAVENRGTNDRIHLVMDMERNSWSDTLFTTLGYDFTRENTPPPVDRQTLQRVIEELEHRDDPASKTLLQKLKQKQTTH